MAFVCVADETGDSIRVCLFLGPIAKVDALYDAGHLDADEVRPSIKGFGTKERPEIGNISLTWGRTHSSLPEFYRPVFLSH